MEHRGTSGSAASEGKTMSKKKRPSWYGVPAAPTIDQYVAPRHVRIYSGLKDFIVTTQLIYLLLS